MYAAETVISALPEFVELSLNVLLKRNWPECFVIIFGPSFEGQEVDGFTSLIRLAMLAAEWLE